MIWLSWRQFRVQAIVISCVLAAFAIALLATGFSLAHLYTSSGLPGCQSHGTCTQAIHKFMPQLRGSIYAAVFYIGLGFIYGGSALVGAFWGAPLVAREIETGTFRVAWNQSVTRNRWLLVKVTMVGLTAMAGAGLLSLMLNWWAEPVYKAANYAPPASSLSFGRLSPLLFGSNGIAPIGYFAFAFTLGLAAGVLIKRTLPAMAVTLVSVGFVMLAWPVWVRPHLIPPVRELLRLKASNIEGLVIPTGNHMTIFAGVSKPGRVGAQRSGAQLGRSRVQRPANQDVPQLQLPGMHRLDPQAAPQTAGQLPARQPVLATAELRDRRVFAGRRHADAVLRMVDQPAPAGLSHPPQTLEVAPMLWLTWRQFRTQALVAAAALTAFAITLLITGIGVRDRARTAGLDGCHATHNCAQLATNFINQLHAGGPYQLLFSVGAVAVYVIPGLIGLFWGAPLIARELETGTYRVAWNQSVSRDRWLATKLGFIGLAAMTTAGLFSLLITWWAGPIDQAIDLAGPDAAIGLVRLDPTLFGARGIVPIGYAAFALVLGVTLGVLIRRTVPAMAATLAIFVGIQIFWPNWIRPHLISPSVARSPLGSEVNEFLISPPSDRVTVLGVWHRSGAWVLSDKTITPAGNVFTGPATKACLQGTQQQCNAWLASKDLRQLVTFQPASRFWAFQWYETAIFVVLAVALAGFCAWRIRRRRLA